MIKKANIILVLFLCIQYLFIESTVDAANLDVISKAFVKRKLSNTNNYANKKTTDFAANTSVSLNCSYCITTGTMDYNTSITSVSINTLNNSTAKPSAYNDYNGISTTLDKGSNYNLSVRLNTDGDYIVYAYAWIDWNQDCDFMDAGETYNLGVATNTSNGITSLSPFNIIIPSSALTGSTRMRIAAKYDMPPTSCETGFDGEVEDYTLNIVSQCQQPGIQATSFVASAISDTSMNVAWIRGNGSAVIVIARKDNPVTIDPTIGISYLSSAHFGMGTAIGNENYVVYNGSSNSVTITSLEAATTYHYAVYEYNTMGYCYKTPALAASATTTGIPSYCIAGCPEAGFEYISSVSLGSINQVSGKGINGYQDFTSQQTTIQKGIYTNAIINTANSNAGNQLLIWIDWNQDGDFEDAGENVYTSSSYPFISPHTTLGFTAPINALTGNTRMRIRLHESGFGSNATPCGNSDFGEVEDYTIHVVAAPLCNLPAIQATAFTSSSVTDTSIHISWTRGNGNKVLVVARQGSIVNSDPVNGIIYAADVAFGVGSQLGSANYVVYNGSGSSVTISALAAGNTYYFSVYEYNDTAYCYKTPALTGIANTSGTYQCTYCVSSGTMDYNTSITAVGFNTINNITYKLSAYTDYTNLSTTVNKNSAYSMAVNLNTDGDFTLQANAWIDWNQDCDFSDAGEEYNLGTATNEINGSTSLSPLSIIVPATAALGNTRMRVTVKYNIASTSCETSFDGEVEDYNLNVVSECLQPNQQATAFSSFGITDSSMNISWTRGNGNSVLVVARQGSAVNQNPDNGSLYTANAMFAGGTQLGTGNYVVYNGNGNSITLTSLMAGTAYYFAVYEYNTSSYCYNAVALTGSGITSNNCIPVSITLQPSATQSSCIPSANINFTVEAIGSYPIVYQWQYNTGFGWENLTDGIPVGAIYTNVNSATMSVSGINTVSTYEYRCLTSNCNGSYTAVSNTSLLNLITSPPEAGVISGDAIVCQGESNVVYRVAAIPNATSVIWSLPADAGGIFSGDSITVNFGLSAVSGNISVKGTNACGIGNSSFKSVVVNPLPAKAQIITGSDTVCQGQQSVIYSVAPINNATSYSWTLTNGASGISLNEIISVNFDLLATSGNITLKGQNSCGDGEMLDKVVTVNPLPVANAGSDIAACAGDTIILEASGGTTYQWNQGVFQGIPFVAEVSNTYIVWVANQYNCSKSDTIAVAIDKKLLILNVILEGLYANNTIMNNALNGNKQPQWGNGTIADKILVEIREAYSPYPVIQTLNADLSVNAEIKTYVNCNADALYYIVLKHRNHLETWSSIPVSFAGDTVVYNFTDADSKAFASNQKQVSAGVYALIVGDVNQDEVVDISDLVNLDIDLSLGSLGYLVNDLTGDGVVDLSDLVAIDENLINGAVVYKP